MEYDVVRHNGIELKRRKLRQDNKKKRERTITTWKLKRRKVCQIQLFLQTLPLQNDFVDLYESIPSSQIRILQNNGKLLQ